MSGVHGRFYACQERSRVIGILEKKFIENRLRLAELAEAAAIGRQHGANSLVARFALAKDIKMLGRFARIDVAKNQGQCQTCVEILRIELQSLAQIGHCRLLIDKKTELAAPDEALHAIGRTCPLLEPEF